MSNIVRRLERLERGSRGLHSEFTDLSDAELEDRLIGVCELTIAHPQTSETARTSCLAIIDEIHASWATWGTFWNRTDVAEIIAKKIARGDLPATWTPPRSGNGLCG